MTQHLLRTSNYYTLISSDRLVSGGIHDPLANKNLIYHARDAVVVMGYAGAADGLQSKDKNIPTDEWIAEILWGQPILRGRDGKSPAALSFGPIPNPLYIGQALKLLQSEVEQSFKQLSPTRTFCLTVAGWRQSRKALRFMVAQIAKTKDGVKIITLERYKYRSRYWASFIAFPAIMPPEHWSQLFDKIPSSPDDCEKFFINEIQNISSKHPDRVGPHCLSILLPPPGAAPIRVRFTPTVEHSAIISSETMSRTVPIAFSPWIIGPTLLCAPAMMNGDFSVSLGNLTVNLEGPPARGTHILSSLPRPPRTQV